MAAHTPGPWSGPTGSITSRSGVVVATVHFHNHPQWEEWIANARLIAAAPDLLEALEEVRDLCEAEQGLVVTGAFVDQVEGIAQAAIAKATGS